MSLTAVVLLVVSAVMHAGWNLVGKRNIPSAAFFLWATFWGGLMLLPVVLPRHDLVALFTARVWLLLLATGFCQCVYYVSLAAAYRGGQMSVAYPLARALPAVILTLTAVLLGRGDALTHRCLGGIAMIVVGCIVLPMRRFRDFRLANYTNAATSYAVMAALGTSGYSFIDSEALALLRAGLGSGRGADGPWVTLWYALFEAVTSAFWLALVVACRLRGRAEFVRLGRTGRRVTAATGIAVYLTYSLVLVAMAFVRDVSYVVAFRQLSIPIGATAAVVFLGEPASGPKWFGVGLMFLGLILVATG